MSTNAQANRNDITAVIEARNRAMSASGPAAKGEAEGVLGQALRQLFALAEAYPQLRAVESFNQLQTSLSESLGPLPGFVLATVLFGAAHAPNALLLEDPEEQRRYLTYGLPFLTAVGAYLGFVYWRRDEDLAPAVAVHFWYDLLVSAVSYALNPDGAPFVVRLGAPL